MDKERFDKLDSIVQNVILKFTDRAEIGFEKYKQNMDRNDLSIIQWIDHSIEEKMEDIIYMQKIKKEILKQNNKEIINKKIII